MRQALMLALLPLALGGCQDNTETDKLRTQLVATRAELAEAREKADADRAELHARIARLEARLGRPSAESTQPTLREELDALKSELAKAKDPETQAALEQRIAAVEGRVEKVKEEALEEARNASPTGGGVAYDEAKIAEMAAKKLAEEQPTKNFNDAINRLNLSDADKQAVKDEILRSKKEMLELLEVPTADGRRFGEELIDTFIAAQMSGENAQPQILKLFSDLNSTKVPGDAQGRTYVEVINEIKKRNRESIGRILKPDDQKKLDKAHGDWTDFEGIEGDPFGALYMQRLKVWQDNNKK